MKNKLIALCIVTLFVISVFPVTLRSQHGHSSAASTSNELVVGSTGGPIVTDLNPTKIFTTYYMAETNVPMIGWDSVGNYVPELAQNWTISADGLTYTFNLRPNLEWSDGMPLNSSDVAFTAKLMAEDSPLWSYIFAAVQEANKSTVTGQSLVPGSVTTPNATQVVFHLSFPSATFLIYAGGQPIYAEHYYAGQNLTGNNPDVSTTVGSGPFIPRSFTPGTELDMVANPHYWGGAPHLSGVIFKYFTDSTSAEIALEGGSINMLQGVPPPDVSSIAKTPGITIGTEGDQSNVFLYLNQHPRLTDNSSNPVSNILVRKAIAMALDLPGILNASFGSSQYYKLANQLEVPNMYYGGQSVQNTTIPSPEYPQNVTGAKALLTQAGFPNGFTVSLVYQSAGVASAGSGATLKMMQLVQSELGAIGITVTLQADDQTTYSNVVYGANPPKTWNLALGVISESPDGDVAPYYMVGSLSGNAGANGFNAEGWNDTMTNQLILQEENTTGASQRLAIFQKLDGYMHEQLPLLEIYYEIQVVAVSNQLQGFQLGLGNPWHDYWGSLKFQSLANVTLTGSTTATSSSSSSASSASSSTSLPTTSSVSSSSASSSTAVLTTSSSLATSSTTVPVVTTSTSSSVSTSTTSSSSSNTLLIGGVVLIIIIIIAALALMMRRRKPAGTPASATPTS